MPRWMPYCIFMPVLLLILLSKCVVLFMIFRTYDMNLNKIRQPFGLIMWWKLCHKTDWNGSLGRRWEMAYRDLESIFIQDPEVFVITKYIVMCAYFRASLNSCFTNVLIQLTATLLLAHPKADQASTVGLFGLAVNQICLA